MEIELNSMRKEDEVSLVLGNLFESYGYKKYLMSRFEEYSLYMENKDFLISDKIITFTDAGGKLMALKPDVTLSIVKNAKAEKGVRKLYYIENVYRPARNLPEFRESEQIGLEAIGDIDGYTVYEVTRLALNALAAVDKDFILDISHVGFVSALIEGLGLDYEANEEIYGYVTGKNLHGLKAASARLGISEEAFSALETLTSVSGTLSNGIEKARKAVMNEGMRIALDELATLDKALRSTEYYDNVRLDFSFVNDIGYYNGIIFTGFTPAVPRPVLSGGRYDKLMKKFAKDAGAIGFAVYVDEIVSYYSRKAEFDQDVFVEYAAGADIAAVAAVADKLRAEGKSVSVGSAPLADGKYRKIMRFDGEKLTEVKDNA
ncbi:MAG: ATP phosphoribosyltransferase regulatory subunit [Firmicutes bacterium]|uniref:ATP phosphoribosyltransferase regulatory subunit n=1 Tax=Candidatus Stercoripulliclostridium pullicola TaxID=2840953 RepID=A0A940DGV3_9FIRM|nr:ATP phosphoribosyltransferase regulatory subunit [Candidatus Stercoripulliclostridium pullicola]